MLRKIWAEETEARMSGRPEDVCKHNTHWVRKHVRTTCHCQTCGKMTDKRIGVWECLHCGIRSCSACVDKIRFPEQGSVEERRVLLFGARLLGHLAG